LLICSFAAFPVSVSLSVTVPTGYVALSNTPATTSTAGGQVVSSLRVLN
jgi:hypothetical protein